MVLVLLRCQYTYYTLQAFQMPRLLLTTGACGDILIVSNTCTVHSYAPTDSEKQLVGGRHTGQFLQLMDCHCGIVPQMLLPGVTLESVRQNMCVRMKEDWEVE